MAVTRFAWAALVALAIPVASPCAAAAGRGAQATADERDLLDYLQRQNSTGIVVIRNGRLLLERSWDPPASDRSFGVMLYGRTREGALLEDVASQQKSFVGLLVAIALDRGLIALDRPVAAYLGTGWSRARPDEEARITVDHLLQMRSGLDERLGYVAPAGSVFFYNTPAYAVTKRLLETVAHRPLDALTQDWLTGPAGMVDTRWRERPGALAGVGNATGLVTTPRDIATLGRLVLAHGLAPDGRRVVSARNLARLFERSPTNPAYGRLWWLNGGSYAIRPPARRTGGPLIAAAPSDMVAALGALDRRLYVVPSRGLVVVRTGAAVSDRDFDEQLWRRLTQLYR